MTKSNLLKGIPWRFGPNWMRNDTRSLMTETHLEGAVVHGQLKPVDYRMPRPKQGYQCRSCTIGEVEMRKCLYCEELDRLGL